MALRRFIGANNYNSSPTFDASYQAILDYATLNSYTLPSASQQILQNDLVVSLKASGVWSKLDLFYNNVNDSGLDFTGINWVNPSLHYKNISSGITFYSNSGVEITGGAGAATTTSYSFSLSAINYSLNDASFGFRMGDSPVSVSSGDFIMSNTSPYASPYTFVSQLAFSALNSAFANVGTFISSDTFTVITRDNSANYKIYNNATLYTTQNTVSSGIPSGVLKLYRNSGGYNGVHQLEYVGGGLTASEISDFNTDFNTYLSAI